MADQQEEIFDLPNQAQQGPPPQQPQQPQQPQPEPGSAEWFTQMITHISGQVAQTILQNMPAPQVIVHTPAPVTAPAPVIPFPTSSQKLFGDPRKFDGKKENARAYIREQEARFAAASTPVMNDQDRILAFTSWFSPGPATQWHQSLYISNPSALTNWTTFINAFKTQFVDPHEATRYRNKLENLRQGYGQSVNEYAQKFKDWAALAEIDEQTKVLWYFRGLAPAVQKGLNVGAGVPSDFATLDLYAQRIDSFSDVIREMPRNGNGQSSGSGNRSNHQHNHQHRGNNSSNYPANNSSSTSSGTSTSGPAPMEIDAVRANLQNGRLTQQERDRRRRDGACMYCGESGHIVSNCPTRAAKSGSGKARPRD